MWLARDATFVEFVQQTLLAILSSVRELSQSIAVEALNLLRTVRSGLTSSSTAKLAYLFPLWPSSKPRIVRVR